jgi:hypothetical protein
MTTDNNRNYRKLSRNFKNKIMLIKRIPLEDNINLFFEICDLNLRNYIDTEKKRFPEKSIKKIIIEMHQKRDNLMRRRKSEEYL